MRCLLLAACACLLAAGDVLDAPFAGTGLTALTWRGGPDLLSWPVPRVLKVTTAAGELPLKGGQPAIDGRTVTWTWPWGSVAFANRLGDARLDWDITVANKHSEAIIGAQLQLLELRLPDAPRWRTWGVKRAPWDPPVVLMAANWGALAGVSDELEKPLGLEFKPIEERTAKGKKPDGKPRWSFELVAGGGQPVFDDEFATREIAPGGSDHYSVSLRFVADETTVMQVGSDELHAFATRHPAAVTWPDRRPIERTFLGREPKKADVFARGRLLSQAKVTLNGDLGREDAIAKVPALAGLLPTEASSEARAKLQARIAGVVNAAKVADSQGVIVWDLEGNTFPHAITYIGDPRSLWWLDPEMELMADAMFKAFADAGLRTGLTIRTSIPEYSFGKSEDGSGENVRQAPGWGPLPHGRGISILDRYNAKIAYARKRWGCSIFYFDTNFHWRPYGPKDAWDAMPIQASVYRRLAELNPDCLFVPEFGHSLEFYGLSAPYGQTNMGAWGTPGEARAAYPGAFRFLAVDEAAICNQIDNLVKAAGEGNVLSWFPDQANAEKSLPTLAIGRVALEGRWLSTPPAEVAQADPAALARLLESPTPEIRYHASRRLAGAPEAARSASRTLAQHAGDNQEDWPVRRQCLLALRHVQDDALLPMLDGLLKADLHLLWHAAATALGGQGSTGRQHLFAALDADYQGAREKGMLWPAIVTAIGASAAAEAAPALRERFANAKDGDNSYKAALVRALGRAKDGECTPWLIDLLAKTANDEVRQACAAALADTGDPQAREILDLALAAARRTKNDGMIEACEAALRRFR